MAKISLFGEPLLEIASASAGATLGPSQLGVAGDTLNTAVYLARLGHEVSFITALGQDAYSDAIVARLEDEGVSTRAIARHPSRVPGLYAIRTDATGERYFTYWRDTSAARDFFSLPEAADYMRAARDSDLFYFTGISLAILTPAHRDALLAVARGCQEHGTTVAFDGNFRPYGWASLDDARERFDAVGRIASVVLPTSEDDDKLYGAASPPEHAARWRGLGARSVVVKNGAEGAWLLEGEGEAYCVGVDQVIQPTDTTGAGDSFNAAFLGALLDGHPMAGAAMKGNQLAGRVIQHRGALIARE
ncbi:MAG: sugar kinase, partial [Pseudomonadota bacterium]